MIIADVGKSFIVIFRNGGFESVVYLGIHSFGTIMKSDTVYRTVMVTAINKIMCVFALFIV